MVSCRLHNDSPTAESENLIISTHIISLRFGNEREKKWTRWKRIDKKVKNWIWVFFVFTSPVICWRVRLSCQSRNIYINMEGRVRGSDREEEKQLIKLYKFSNARCIAIGTFMCTTERPAIEHMNITSLFLFFVGCGSTCCVVNSLCEWAFTWLPIVKYCFHIDN